MGFRYPPQSPKNTAAFSLKRIKSLKQEPEVRRKTQGVKQNSPKIFAIYFIIPHCGLISLQ